MGERRENEAVCRERKVTAVRMRRNEEITNIKNKPTHLPPTVSPLY
jgi:hypothetical protein